MIGVNAIAVIRSTQFIRNNAAKAVNHCVIELIVRFAPGLDIETFAKAVIACSNHPFNGRSTVEERIIAEC